MKRFLIALILPIAFVLFTAGVSAQSAADMKSLVASMNKEMIELAIAGRFEAMGKFYDENAISLPNYRAMEKGYNLILNNNLGKKRGGYNIIDGQKITTELIVGSDMMADIGQYSLTITFPGLSGPKTDSGKYMNVWKKGKDGSWRIVAETWNADKSPNVPATGKPSEVKIGQPVKPTSTNN